MPTKREEKPRDILAELMEEFPKLRDSPRIQKAIAVGLIQAMRQDAARTARGRRLIEHFDKAFAPLEAQWKRGEIDDAAFAAAIAAIPGLPAEKKRKKRQ